VERAQRPPDVGCSEAGDVQGWWAPAVASMSAPMSAPNLA